MIACACFAAATNSGVMTSPVLLALVGTGEAIGLMVLKICYSLGRGCAMAGTGRVASWGRVCC